MEEYRDTYLEVHLDRLRDNIKYIHSVCQKNMMAIVKANGYGHGDRAVVAECERHDCIISYGVATLGEGLNIRDYGVTKPILVLGATRIEDLPLASRYNISISIISLEFAKAVSQQHFKGKLRVHIAVDTGMNRIGVKTKEDFEEVIAVLSQNERIEIEGAFTHFAAADEPNDSSDIQFKKYRDIVGDHYFKLMHSSNTAGALYRHEDFTNMVRVGIALYGLEPDGHEPTPLKQVMSLKTTVVYAKTLKKGEQVGYGLTYTADHDSYLAVVPIGYADGLVRQNQGRMVYIKGQYYPIVGRVCMDQMMIEVDESVQTGDEVEIFGDHISLNRMASELGTISYEICCLMSLRVKRIYLDNK